MRSRSRRGIGEVALVHRSLESNDEPPDVTLNKKWIPLDVWKVDVLLLWGGTVADAVPHVQRIAPEAVVPETGVHGFTWLHPGQAICVWVERLDPASLAHEFLHVVMPLMYDRGLRSGPGTVEAYCYTLEALMRAAVAADRPRAPRGCE